MDTIFVTSLLGAVFWCMLQSWHATQPPCIKMEAWREQANMIQEHMAQRYPTRRNPS